MELTIESALSPGAFFGHLSYGLLIVSMLMTRMIWLRVFAIGSGLVALVYDIFWLYDPVGVVWETLFVAVNVAQLGLIYFWNRMARFSEEERAFHLTAVPDLEPSQVRHVLRHGRLREADTGTVLLVEGEAVDDLIFVLSGRVDITLRGELIGECGPNTFIGEIGVSTDGPASASAVVTAPIRYIAFDGVAVRRLLGRGGDIARAIDSAFRHGLREKLLLANEALVATGQAPVLRDP